MHMPLDVILEACDKTSLTAEKPSLSYVDKILAKWHKAGITTLAGVKQADDDFAQKREAKDTPKPKAAKNNRFINFDQRDNDYTQIERLERQDLLKYLKG